MNAAGVRIILKLQLNIYLCETFSRLCLLISFLYSLVGDKEVVAIREEGLGVTDVNIIH